MSGDEKLEVVTAVPDRAMVIFAHPDDAEIGSGGVVAKWVAAGCEVGEARHLAPRQHLGMEKVDGKRLRNRPRCSGRVAR